MTPTTTYRVFAPDRIVFLDEDNPRYARRRIFTPHDQIRYTFIISRSVDLALQVVVSIYLAKRYTYCMFCSIRLQNWPVHAKKVEKSIFYIILALKKGWLFVQVLCLLYCIVTSTVYLVALPAFWIIFCNLLDNNMKSTTLIGNDNNLNISEYLLMGWSESHLTLKCQWHRTFTPLYRQIFTDI